VIKDLKYGFRSRFENEPGTNPEELIAAAHASCFSMALSGQLGERGINPQAIETTCAITLENMSLTTSALRTTVKARGADSLSRLRNNRWRIIITLIIRRKRRRKKGWIPCRYRLHLLFPGKTSGLLRGWRDVFC